MSYTVYCVFTISTRATNNHLCKYECTYTTPSKVYHNTPAVSTTDKQEISFN